VQAAVRNQEGYSFNVSRFSIYAYRNAENLQRIEDSIEGSVTFQMHPPPILLPDSLISFSLRNARNRRPVSYPFNVTLSCELVWRTHSENTPHVYPVSLFGVKENNFHLAKTGIELLHTFGIFQLRPRFLYRIYPEKENETEFSINASVRLRRGRLSLRVFKQNLQEKDWNYTVSWRLVL
jgi:hypothetical protein